MTDTVKLCAETLGKGKNLTLAHGSTIKSYLFTLFFMASGMSSSINADNNFSQENPNILNVEALEINTLKQEIEDNPKKSPESLNIFEPKKILKMILDNRAGADITSELNYSDALPQMRFIIKIADKTYKIDLLLEFDSKDKKRVISELIDGKNKKRIAHSIGKHDFISKLYAIHDEEYIKLISDDVKSELRDNLQKMLDEYERA